MVIKVKTLIFLENFMKRSRNGRNGDVHVMEETGTCTVTWNGTYKACR